MGSRGKKPISELSVIKPTGITAIQRPEPADGMTDEQAHEWKAVVNRMPADWFPRETHALLEQYCRHVVSARRVAEIVDIPFDYPRSMTLRASAEFAALTGQVSGILREAAG